MRNKMWAVALMVMALVLVWVMPVGEPVALLCAGGIAVATLGGIWLWTVEL